MVITSEDVVYCAFRERTGDIYNLQWAVCKEDEWIDLGLVAYWTADVYNHSLAIDGEDTLWALITTGSPVASSTLKMSHRDGDNWTEPVQVHSEFGVYGVAEVTLSIAADEIYIGFVSSPAPYLTVYKYNQGSPAIEYQYTVENIITYSMQIDRFDNLHIVGSDNTELYHFIRYSSDGSWNVTHDIIPSDNPQIYPCLVPLYNSDLWAAFADKTENKVKYALQRNGVWSDPENISQDTASESQVITRHARFPIADWNTSYIDVFYADEDNNALCYAEFLTELPSSLHEPYYGYDLERTIKPSSGPDDKDYAVHVAVNRGVSNKLSNEYNPDDTEMYKVKAQVGTLWHNIGVWKADDQQDIKYDLITHDNYAYPSQNDDTKDYLKGMPLGQIHVVDSEIDEVMDIRVRGGGIALKPEGAVVNAAMQAGLPVPDVGISRETAEEMRLSYADLVNGPPVNASRTLVVDIPRSVLDTMTEEQVHSVIQRHLAAGVGYVINWNKS